MANVSDPNAPVITTAESATVVNDNPQELLMRLRNGEQHEVTPPSPISTTSPLSPPPTCPSPSARRAMCTWAAWIPPSTPSPRHALLQRIHQPDGKRFLIELNNRFSYPAACLVLMLVGVPLGVVSRRGGKSSGFVFTLLLVVLYYVLSYTGESLARQDKLPVASASGSPTCSLPREASFFCGRWPAAGAYSRLSSASLPAPQKIKA